MPDAALRVSDLEQEYTTALRDVIANDNLAPDAESHAYMVRALDARDRRDFDEAERHLMMALESTDHDLQATTSDRLRKQVRTLRADTFRLLADMRLESTDFDRAEELYRDAIKTIPPDAADERRRFAQAAGNSVRSFASLLGRVDAARLSVEFLRTAVSLAPHDADVQNGLGLSCLELAELTWSPDAFREARVAFEAALKAAGPSDQVAAFRIRVEINLAAALRRLANFDEQAAARLLSEAGNLLRGVISTIQTQPGSMLPGPAMHVDLPRAWDNLGGVLFDQKQWDAAITAYTTARHGWIDPLQRAGTLVNLGLTFGNADRLNDALNAFDDAAAAAQPLDGNLETTHPMAWSRAQQFRGAVLRRHGELLAESEPEKSREYFEEALAALTAALRSRQRQWAPGLWAQTVASMAMVHQCLRHDGEAISLYYQSFIRVPAVDLPEVSANFKKLIPRTDFEATVLVWELVNSSDNDLLAAITALLDSRGIAREKWGETCIEIGQRLVASTAETKAARQPATRETMFPGRTGPSPAVDQRRKTILALPPLPRGLRWPTELFDQSPHFQKRGGIERHLDEVWRPLIKAGVVDMAVLRTFYPSTAHAIDSLRKRGRKLPPDLTVPQVSPGSGRRRKASLPITSPR